MYRSRAPSPIIRFVLPILLVSLSGLGADDPNVKAPSNDAQFHVSPGVLDRIYRESLTEAKVNPKNTQSALEIRPLFSIFIPSQLTLSNRYFDVLYAESFQQAPALSFGLASHLAGHNKLALFGEGRVGILQKEGLVNANAKNGEVTRDTIRLHMVPISAGLRLDIRVHDLFVPSLAVGGGASWLYQSGKLDGIEQGFWIPFVQISPAVKIFGSPSDGGWFGGITLGTTYYTSLLTAQTLRALSIDVGATFSL